MNVFPFRRKDDISPEDALNAGLNARASNQHDDTSRPEGESLTATAQQFHAWADAAQERDPDAKGPADDLWNKILVSGGRLHVDPAARTIDIKDAFRRPNVDTPGNTTKPLNERQGEDMSTTFPAAIGDHLPPQSNRMRRMEAAAPSRSGAWFNAIVAALLVLTLGGGAYLGGNGGFSFGGGGDEGRYAAQVASPEASPETAEVIGRVEFQADGVCEAEPLSEDQVFDIVMNPLNGFLQQGIVLEEGTPEPLLEVPWQGGDQQRPSSFQDPNPLHRASEDEAASVNAFVTEYYECLESGTSYQVWGLIMPYDVQSRILSNFPVLRSEEQIRDYIVDFGPQDFSATVRGQGHEYFFEQGYGLQGNENPLSLWVNPGYAFPDVVILSGVSVLDENGEVVAAVDYNGRPSVLQPGVPGVPETLEIAYFAETNTWYISETYSLRG
jgi:hypothetical protein